MIDRRVGGVNSMTDRRVGGVNSILHSEDRPIVAAVMLISGDSSRSFFLFYLFKHVY